MNCSVFLVCVPVWGFIPGRYETAPQPERENDEEM